MIHVLCLVVLHLILLCCVSVMLELCGVGECPDEVTMLSLLSACADLGDLESGEKVHAKIIEMNKGKLSTLLGNALVDMYAKCGNIGKGVCVFWLIRDKDMGEVRKEMLNQCSSSHP